MTPWTDLEEALLLYLLQHGYHQPLGRVHRHTDVVVRVIDELAPALAQAGVEDRVLLQGQRGRLVRVCGVVDMLR